ncbi:MAG: bacillithiol biosynthesis deacetylase BshB1 [Gemmatimonadetes bacterium]|nr:MAG: bacillithiol biosynthesis deacetylase BshB1 [Gemmatimonadota bacterium]
MGAPLDVLAAFAHPDDAELLCGGALIRSADAGERVGVLDLTRGEGGSQGSAELRAREAEAAAEVMGLAVRRNAGLPDAALQNTLEARRVVAGLLRELRPRVVVTHWRDGRHPDHRAAAELVYDACFLAGLRRFDAPGEPFRPFKVVHAIAFREDAPRPTFLVDVTEQMERRLAALACYASQFDGKSQAGEVFPGGERPLPDQVRAHLAAWGARARVAYAEPFWTREAVRVETLGGVDVSTF